MAEAGVIVQARMNSARVPGKVLRPLAGRPLLGHLLDRLGTLGIPVVVATSDHPGDNELASFCEAEGVAMYRGALDDVAARFVGAARQHGVDPIVRVSGDSPLLDPALVRRALGLWKPGVIVTNVRPRTFPTGQSVEAFELAALEGADVTDETREHVTTTLYERLRIENFSHSPDLSHLRLTLDTERDAARLDALFERMDRPPSEYALDELVALCSA
jgi:spore coat polysaccharide biosynthesis protein SpsF (cytidylyltransferase family)